MTSDTADIDDPSWPPNTSHHIDSPPTSFINPWSSFKQHTPIELLKTRFGANRNFVPIPTSRAELVPVRTPDWGATADPNGQCLKTTWIGHASFLVETPNGPQANRGVRILLDPVFSERTSPFSFVGPKRYTPTPCNVADLPEIDLCCISHNHYDHLDINTIREVMAKSSRTKFLVPLGLRSWFLSLGLSPDRVLELDWWHAVECTIPHIAAAGIRLVCTPAQHISARGLRDQGKTLWCSWAIGSSSSSSSSSLSHAQPTTTSHPAGDDAPATITLTPLPLPTQPTAPSPFLHAPTLYFAGDTGYRSVPALDPSKTEATRNPHCPAFRTIGTILGPFDLALLPIGLYSPRNVLSSVHCCPEDAVDLAKDVRARYSLGMHWGTVRGGISAQYEDVLEPPRRWRRACEEGGLEWGVRAGLCDVGETVVVRAAEEEG